MGRAGMGCSGVVKPVVRRRLSLLEISGVSYKMRTLCSATSSARSGKRPGEAMDRPAGGRRPNDRSPMGDITAAVSNTE